MPAWKHCKQQTAWEMCIRDSKEALHFVLDMMGLYLGGELKVEIKINWQIFPVDARSIDDVGFKQNHYGILLRSGILKRFYKKFHRTINKYCLLYTSKEALQVNWDNYHGIVRDKKRPRYQERNITLDCFIEASGRAAYVE